MVSKIFMFRWSTPG